MIIKAIKRVMKERAAKKARDAQLRAINFDILRAQSRHGKTRHLHKAAQKVTHDALSRVVNL